MDQIMLEVPVRDVNWADPLQCFNNVARMVTEHGGRMRCGWAVEEQPLFVEHIHHAVWEDASGDCWEITPGMLTASRSGFTLFLPDNEARPTPMPGMRIGLTLPNRYYPAKNDKKLQRMCEYLSRGSQAYHFGKLDSGKYWTGKAAEVANRFLGPSYRFLINPPDWVAIQPESISTYSAA